MRELCWKLSRGASVEADGGFTFRVWAPNARSLAVYFPQPHRRMLEMEHTGGGVSELTVREARHEWDYQYLINGDARPDPVSRWQPYGVHGPSRIVDPSAFHWTDHNWPGLELEEFVFYEAHVGLFSPEGSFEGAAKRLPHLKDLGVTALELMPVAEFPGRRNWGYDGVSLYAPHSCYGGPDGLKRLVNACHENGMAFVLDVVYNHLGPEGNYLGEFGPYFTDSYRTPWGDAINFDGRGSDEVRRFFIDNALYWLTEYHVDALRVDAIHGIFDFSARHFLQELAEEFHAEAARLGRKAYLIAESDLNDVRVLRPAGQGGYGIDAQWCDDFHHSIRAALSGGAGGYLADFSGLGDLKKAITEGFVYDGRYSAYRGRRHGSSSKDRPGWQFVVFVQNHDQIANASAGQRLSAGGGLERQKLAAMVQVCAPALPLLFMGEEYAETAPFHYFTNHADEALGRAVSDGRRREFASFFESEEFPDPQDERTFQQAKLNWDLAGLEPHASILRFYRDLLRLRRAQPCLRNCRRDLTRLDVNEEDRWLAMRRTDEDGGAALLFANFSDKPVLIPAGGWEGTWRLAMWSGAPIYGGDGRGWPPDALEAGVPDGQELRLEPYRAVLYVQSGRGACTEIG